MKLIYGDRSQNLDCLWALSRRPKETFSGAGNVLFLDFGADYMGGYLVTIH